MIMISNDGKYKAGYEMWSREVTVNTCVEKGNLLSWIVVGSQKMITSSQNKFKALTIDQNTGKIIKYLYLEDYILNPDFPLLPSFSDDRLMLCTGEKEIVVLEVKIF